MCRKFYLFPSIKMPFTGKEKAFRLLNVKFWIVSTHPVKIWDHLNDNWLVQVIRLWNINFSETPCTSKMISNILKHSVY